MTTIDTEGRTVLSIASSQGNVDVVRQLLERGLDEMHRDNSGMTPLHMAACDGHKEVCIYLHPLLKITILKKNPSVLSMTNTKDSLPL